MSVAAARPTPSSDRIEFLDVLRGVALFGILVVNLPFLGLPLSEAGDAPSLWAAGGAIGETGGGSGAWTAALIRALAENKFMGLFSLLFGMGLALQVDRAEARGVNPISFYPRRLVVLAAFGVLNGVFIFFGDILLPYAVAGAALFLLRRCPPRTMLWIAGVFLAVGITLSVLFEGIYVNGSSGGDGERALDQALADGTFLQGSAARGQVYVLWLFLSSIIAFNWRIMALFLVGAALLRRGWADPSARHLHRRLAIGGLALGLTLEGASLWLHGRDGATVGMRVLDVLMHQLGGLSLSAGYAGLVALWCASPLGAGLRRGLAATGRMALTNYLGQNIIAGLIFYGHGAGRLGDFSRPQLVG
ncbi:MAG: DUF418 domain-containing protein, partial [Planctomycetota bacterium]|nr:DUF418 domain-containing protein [Planctomycetota bacterium]